jgi:glycosyltransferase involved in cell wall biosynthesis
MLKDFGHEVKVLLPPYDNLEHSGTRFEVDGICIQNVMMPLSKSPIKYLYVGGELLKEALDFRPDIVHVFKPKGYSGLAAIFLVAAKYLGITKAPLFLDTDDWEGFGGFADFFLEHKSHSRTFVNFFDFQERWLLKHADVVTAASKTLESMAINLRGKSKLETVLYIPNGPKSLGDPQSESVEAIKSNLGIKDKKVVLLYTRFFEYDVKEVIEILIRLVSRFRNLKLLVVGKGEFGESEELWRFATNAGLREYVIIVGWVKPEMIPSYLEIGDVAIYPFKDTLLNRSKSSGKLLQLMNAGKAIVADEVGEITQYIENGKSGILVKPGNIAEFADSVLKLLEREDLRTSMGCSARKRVQDTLNWETLSRKVELAYSIHKI